MRKYHVIDEDGSEYQVEELDEELVESPEELEDDEPIINTLSEEEIEALKKLAAVADRLVALTETKDSDMDEDNLVDEDEDEELEDSDEDKEEVIDTDEEEEEKGKTPARDSKKSFGSLEAKKKKVVEDSSLVDEVSDAWAKRFGGLK